MEVVQGTARGYAFTINTKVYNQETEEYDTIPFDLTSWAVNFYVKTAPYYSIEPMIKKVITTTSDISTEGQINDPTAGKFFVQIIQTDTLFPPRDYYLVIELTNGSQIISLTGNANYKSVFRILTQ